MKFLKNKVLKNYLLLMVPMFLIEIIFRVVLNLSLIDWAMLRIFIFVNMISLILAVLYSFLGRIAGNIFTFLTVLITSIYAIAQAGFANFVGVFMSFGTSSQAGAVTDYFKDYIESFKPEYWLMFIPVALLLIYYIVLEHRIPIIEKNETIDFSDKFDSEERKKQNSLDKKKITKKISTNSKINAIVVAVILIVLFYVSTIIPFMQNKIQLKSNAALLKNPDMPNIAVSQFGINGYGFLDIKSLIIPSQDDSYSEYKKVKQKITDYSRKIDDTEWEKLIEEETNTKYKQLNSYFISQNITDKNEYTGMFKNKNLIVIMMESVNNVVINKDYYPNIYKLYNEGWTWTNAYSPRNSCSTGNNEMSGMVSLYTINNSCTANIYKKNLYPESLFNLFNNAGYTTSSYHNYTEHYYRRKVIHPNMGSGHYYGVKELGIPYSNAYKEWPSDVELMDKFLELTESQEKFMSWITTVSSHQPYGVSSELGDLYLDSYKDTNYNIKLKRYMSKLKVLDNAIGELIDGLKEQDKLDDTVIVLYADHYPYGISKKILNEYFDYDVSVNKEVDRTPFIIYNPNLTPTKHEEYTTFMNIVPTLANLFDLDYDPRLYTGNDLFSDTYESRAYFADGSWQDEKAFYNATKGQIIYKDENNTYTEEEIQKINQTINDKIKMSNLAIKTNYFNYLDERLVKKQTTQVANGKAEKNESKAS